MGSHEFGGRNFDAPACLEMHGKRDKGGATMMFEDVVDFHGRKVSQYLVIVSCRFSTRGTASPTRRVRYDRKLAAAVRGRLSGACRRPADSRENMCAVRRRTSRVNPSPL